MKTEKKKELLLAGLVIPWVIVAILALVAYLSISSGKTSSKKIEELGEDKKELIAAGNKASADLRNAQNKASADLLGANKKIAKLKKITNLMPPLTIFQKSWKGKHGNIYILHSLQRTGELVKLKRTFSDGSSGEIIVELKKVGSDTHLNPQPPAETGDYYVISGKLLMCLDKSGSVYSADEE